MTPELIKQALQNKDCRQIDVIKRLGMPLASRPIVSYVINRMARSRRVENAISEITGHPLHELWPEWYSAPNAAKQRKRAS